MGVEEIDTRYHTTDIMTGIERWTLFWNWGSSQLISYKTGFFMTPVNFFKIVNAVFEIFHIAKRSFKK